MISRSIWRMPDRHADRRLLAVKWLHTPIFRRARICFGRRSALGRFDSLTRGHPNGRNRRISPVALRHGEGLITDPTTAVQRWSRERVFMVESECGAVAVGRTYLLPPLSSDGASLVRPWLRFHVHRVTGGGRPPPVPTERGVRISRTNALRQLLHSTASTCSSR